MLNFSHTYLYFKHLKRTYFCEIYVILWNLIGNKKTSFSILKSLARLLWRSTGRSTAPRAGRPSRSTDVHETCTKACPLGRSTARLTAGSTLKKMTVGRSTGWSTGREKLPFPGTNGKIYFWVINTHLFGLF